MTDPIRFKLGLAGGLVTDAEGDWITYRTHVAAIARLAECERDMSYYKWRLQTILPLFEEARDALTAIPLVSAKLCGLDLSLADRMGSAGTATRADFDAAMGGGT